MSSITWIISYHMKINKDYRHIKQYDLILHGGYAITTYTLKV